MEFETQFLEPLKGYGKKVWVTTLKNTIKRALNSKKNLYSHVAERQYHDRKMNIVSKKSYVFSHS